MVEQLINKELLKKGVYLDNSTVFENLVALTNQLFETPILSICRIEDKKLNYHYLQGINFEAIPSINLFANYCLRKKDHLIIPDFKNHHISDLTIDQGPNTQFLFYAGIPLYNELEELIGLFEIADFVPRDFSENQTKQLKLIAKQIQQELLVDSKLKSWENDLLAYSVSSNILFCFVDQSFKIINFNKLFASFINIHFEKTVEKGADIIQYIPMNYRTYFTKSLDLAMEGKDSEVEQFKKYNDVQSLWIDTFTCIKDSSDNFIGVAIRSKEIVAETNKTKDYEANDHRNNLLLQELEESWWDKDFIKNETFYSPKWWEMLGLKPDTTQSKNDHWKTYLHPDDIVKFEKFNSSTDFKNRTSFEIELRLRHANGYYIPVLSAGKILKNEEGEIIRVFGSNIDLTRIKKAEEQADESKSNLLTIFNHAPTAMLIARPDDGLIIMVNKELQSLAEADAVDLIGMYTTDFYAYNFERDLFMSVMEEKGSVKNLELRIKKKDGSIANCLVSSEMITWKGEKMLLSGFIDITERKKSESLLIQNEERFRSLYNRTPVMLHSLNQNGDFVSVSDYWLAKLGYQRLQIIGKNIGDFFTKASFKDSVKVRIPELNKRGYDFDIPYQVIKRNGEIMDVLVSTIIEKSPDQNEFRYLAVMQDVTERKKLDEALQQSEDNLRTIFENTNIGYALLDADFFIVSFNSMMQKFAQNDLHKTLYLHTFSVLYFAEARQAALTAALKSVLEGQTVSYEINYIQPDGSDKWYKMNMFPVFNKKSVASGIVMAVEDINETKLKEIHLSKVVKEITDYKLALDESSIVIISDENGIITYANENCLKITEYSLDDILGKNINFLDSGYHNKAYFTEMWDTIQSGNIWKGELRNKNNSEHYFWVDCTIVPFVDINKKLYQYISIQRDITKTKNAEIELNKSFSLVNEQNKRLLNFSYIVSHNLRSHTSNIISILNFLEKEDTVAEKSELLQHLKRVSLSLNDTLYNLNEVVSIRNNMNMVMEPLNLREYILQALGVLSEQIIQKNVMIENEVPENTLVNYNPAYLESVVLNFISNAIKYSSPERQPRIVLSITHENGSMILNVIDNGIGIDMKKNGDKLFGMYKTFNNNPDARGIGLFITKNQIDAMGGKVEVESEIGKGTSFKIYFANSNA
jgi:PAS domain S-box-containing protein